MAGAPARATVGGAPAAASRSVVMILGSRGSFCSATAIAADIVLTAAHCVEPGADYKLAEPAGAGAPVLQDIARIVRAPQFRRDKLLAHRASADLALARMARPLPAAIRPAPLERAVAPVAAGAALVVAGYGVAVPGDSRSSGTLRRARLVATDRPDTLQLRLVDPRTQDKRPGLGACGGDSGAPVLRDQADDRAVVGVVSWATAPRLGAGCGGLTGVTPLARYRPWIVQPWIVQAAHALGARLD